MTRIQVWDDSGAPPGGVTVLWRSDGPAEAVSVPRLVEAGADRYRQRYLSWVTAVGRATVDGRSLIDHFTIAPPISCWWASLIAERCNFDKSPGIEDAIRLMAFDEWAQGQSLSHLTLHSASAALAASLQAWCERRGVRFEWQRRPPVRAHRGRRRLYDSLAAPLQALGWLGAYLARRWSLRGAGVAEWRASTATTTLVSYFQFSAAPRDGRLRFASYFWTALPAAMDKAGSELNWLHVYVPDAVLPGGREARRAIEDFNAAGAGLQRHTTLDSFLSVALVMRVLVDWCRLAIAGRRCARRLVPPDSDGLVLWPLFASDFHQSYAGAAGVAALLFQHLFSRALQQLPPQRLGVYHYENQNWEAFLLQWWRHHGHGRLIGHAHATIRFWDLRYHWDPARFVNVDRFAAPLPDAVAVTGPAAVTELRRSGYPEDAIIEVEALRYLFLDELRHRRQRSPRPRGEKLRLLVFADYAPAQTKLLLELLQDAFPRLDAAVQVTVKPHPVCPITPSDYPALPFTVTDRTASELLADCDLVLTSANTSAAVDAYCVGVAVASIRNPSTMNLSPLRGWPGVAFAGTVGELVGAINELAAQATVPRAAPAFFCVDPTLRRWRELLDLHGEHAPGQ